MQGTENRHFYHLGVIFRTTCSQFVEEQVVLNLI